MQVPGGNNPFKFIEMALTEAKQKIEKMKATPQILESLPDNEKKKKFLKAENKLLRENLKRMSDNVNVLIDKMSQETMKQSQKTAKPGKSTHTQAGIGSNMGDGGYVEIGNDGKRHAHHTQHSQHGKPARSVAGNTYSPNSKLSMGIGVRGTIAEREVQIADKAIVNLMKEHNKLKKRLELV